MSVVQLFNFDDHTRQLSIFLSISSIHHMQRVKLRLTHDVRCFIWVPPQHKWIAPSDFVLVCVISSRYLYYFFAAGRQLSNYDTSLLNGGVQAAQYCINCGHSLLKNKASIRRRILPLGRPPPIHCNSLQDSNLDCQERLGQQKCLGPIEKMKYLEFRTKWIYHSMQIYGVYEGRARTSRNMTQLDVLNTGDDASDEP